MTRGAERPRAARDRALKQRGTRRTRGPHRQDIARPVLKPLGIFKQSQLLGDADADQRVRADAEGAAGGQIVACREDAVAEIGLGKGTKPGHGARRRQALRFFGRHVGGMDQAPARIDIRMVEQPFDRPLPAKGQAGLDLAHLLGGVDMDRARPRQADNDRQFLSRHSAQAVRRHAG